ncbi:hypothetical protein [Ferrimonas sp.]|uniref:hypothetical protein n=1 Tax=Ferrimonas sp. TaxID=2080861 RepID=UPI003A8E78A1
MVRKTFKIGLVFLALAGLTGCSEDNQQRVELALTEAGQAMEVLGNSASELAQVAWLESQRLWESGETLAREKQLAFNQWRQPAQPMNRYGGMELTEAQVVTEVPKEDPSQAHSNKEESHHP